MRNVQPYFRWISFMKTSQTIREINIILFNFFCDCYQFYDITKIIWTKVIAPHRCQHFFYIQIERLKLETRTGMLFWYCEVHQNQLVEMIRSCSTYGRRACTFENASNCGHPNKPSRVEPKKFKSKAGNRRAIWTVDHLSNSYTCIRIGLNYSHK